MLTPLHKRKLSHSMYQKYLLQCRRSYRTLLLNAEAVQTAEKALALMLGLQVLQSHFASLGFLQLCCSTLVYLLACLAQAQEGLPGTGGRDPCAYTPALSCHHRSFVPKTLRVYGPIQVCQGVPRLEATSRCLLIPDMTVSFVSKIAFQGAT